MKRLTSVKFDEATHKQLFATALAESIRRGKQVSVSAVIREAVSRYLGETVPAGRP